ncbi:MAG: diaminopimelate decarboxylase [Alphaproteobacteria bacterium]
MHHFEYKAGVLHAEDVPLPEIAAKVGTPFYCYCTATLTRHYQVFAGAFEANLQGGDEPPLVCYSAKANGNQAVLATLIREGAGVDVVSGGELQRALQAGCPANRIVFSGVGKTHDEMRAALQAGIYQFNVESEPELERLNTVAGDMGAMAPITIRVNPDVDAKTHEKISTGKAENKFGIPWTRARDVYARAGALPHIRVVGVDVHIGSQLTSLTPFEAAFDRVAELVHALREDGHDIRRLDLGGGLGIPYEDTAEEPPHPDDYAAMVSRVAGNLGCRLIFEPGRMIAGNAGILVSDTIYVKEGEDRRFVIIDAAMNDLIRPSMYSAWHEIRTVNEPPADAPYAAVDLVGPVCETGDTFARTRPFPPIAEGELVAIMSAGAYGAVMASTYNTRALIPEVLVNGNKFAVIRPRLEVEDIIARDVVPDWLQEA